MSKKKIRPVEKQVTVNQKRADAITEWIKLNPKMATENILVQNQIPIERHGREEFQIVYRLPRALLRLNPDNHRFATDWDNLKADRRAQGKKGELNLEDEADVKEIRDVLTGVSPPNSDRITSFDVLKTAIQRAAEAYRGNSGQVTDHNGQTMAGIITYDGRYINANRRDTAFHEIQKERGKHEDVRKFDYIFVARCPEDIWDDDVLTMEMSAQMGMEIRDGYDYMNAALLCRAKFKSIYDPRVVGLTSQTEKNKARNEAIAAVASKVDLGKKGQGVKKIDGYLKFLEFVDGILYMMKLGGKYNLVNKSSGDKNPVSYLLQEAVKVWNKKSAARDRSDFMKAIAMECCIHQANSTKDQFTVRDNYRTFRDSITHLETKQMIKNTVNKFNFKEPEKSAKVALQTVKKAVAQVNAFEEASKPQELLDKVLIQLQAILRAITTGTAAKDKLKKLSTNQDDISAVITLAQRIATDLRAFSKNKTVTKNQSPKPKVKKKKVQKNRKPNRRLSARNKSKR